MEDNKIAVIIRPLGRYGYTRVAVSLYDMCAQLDMNEQQVELFKLMWEEFLAGTLIDMQVFEENFKDMFPAYNMIITGPGEEFYEKIFNIYITKKGGFGRLKSKLFKRNKK